MALVLPRGGLFGDVGRDLPAGTVNDDAVSPAASPTQRESMTHRRTILVTGASGLVGSALVQALRRRGDVVRMLTRRPSGEGEFGWDPLRGEIDRRAFDGLNVDGRGGAVVHLAGESIAGGRWSDERKRLIRESRVVGTRLVAEACGAASPRIEVLVAASAIGYYGDGGERTLTERSSSGEGFLPEVCRAWEDAADPARAAGVRTAHARSGMVLSARGGALAKMMLPFRLGFGGPIGSGKQWMSWIHLDDEVEALLRLLDDPDCQGPYNLVSPNAATNREFVTALGLALRRPALLPMPAFAARLLFGEMGERLLLEGAKVLPSRLMSIGFRWAYPELAAALRAETSRARDEDQRRPTA